jgi:hypothetical protein
MQQIIRVRVIPEIAVLSLIVAGLTAACEKIDAEGRLNSALNSLRSTCHYRGNPDMLLAERKRKLEAAALR